jgi:hypothetical protein
MSETKLPYSVVENLELQVDALRRALKELLKDCVPCIHIAWDISGRRGHRCVDCGFYWEGFKRPEPTVSAAVKQARKALALGKDKP